MTRASHLLRKLSFLVAGISLSLSAYGEEFVVKVKSQFNMNDFASQLSKVANVKILDQHAPGQVILIRTPSTVRESDLQSSLESLPAFEYVVPNIKFHMIEVPNDPHYKGQWALKKVGAEKAWSLSKNDKRPIIAVIDTGVDYKHEDLAAQIARNQNGTVNGWNFIENNDDPMDIISTQPRGNPGHGTHCAGIIAAAGDNGIGVSGIAPKALIMPLRFIGPDGSGDLMNSIKAIDFAIQHGAQIISASWGAAVQRSVVKPLLEAIERAGQKGIVFVAAAANDGKSNDTREVYPANAGLPNVISVAASDKNDAKPTWSNYGRAKVDMASPGAAILSTLPNNKYGELSGTSMATPLVAGMVALLLAQSVSIGQQFNAVEFKALLQAHSQKVQIETACNCRVSAESAMTAVVENTLTVVPNAGSFAPNATAKFHAIGGHAPFKFTSSNPNIASISEEGEFKAIAEGSSTIKATDSDGHTALSQEIYVGTPKQQPPGGGEKCPFDNAQLCDMMCQIMPTLPWCKQIATSSSRAESRDLLLSSSDFNLK